MDCSLLIGAQLEALSRLATLLAEDKSPAGSEPAWRELVDRAAAHLHIRERVVLEVFRTVQGPALPAEALAPHAALKRALAALCICHPGDPDFDQMLATFSDALARQRGADAAWIVPTLRTSTSLEQRRALCFEIETLHEMLVPPATHYLLEEDLVGEAAVVLRSLGPATGGTAAGRPG